MTRKGLYSTELIPFPKKLMNTATSPSALSLDYARFILNMTPVANKAGVGRKRNGLVDMGTAIGGGVITYLAEFIKSDGTAQDIAYVNDGSLHYTEDSGANWTSIKTGMNTAGTVGSVVFNNTLVFWNGLDSNFTWDGATATDLSEEVAEQLSKEWADEDSLTISTPDDLTSRYVVGETIELRYKGTDLEVTSITRTSTTATITTTNNHGLLTGEKINIRGALPTGYNGEFEITATPSVTTMEVVVDGSLTTPATVDQDSMAMVKGESIPITEWQEATFPSDNGTTPNLIVNSGGRVTGYKATIKKFPAGGVDRMSATIYYRVVGNTEWIESQTVANIGGATKQSFELSNLSPEVYEFRLESGYTPRNVKITQNEFQTVTSGKIVNNGNRLVKENIVNIASITRTGSVATVTTSVSHGLDVTDAVTIFNIEQEDYNGTYIVTASASDTTFTYEVANDPVTPATIDPTLLGTITCDFDNIKRTPEIATSVFASETQTLTFTTNPMPDEAVVSILGIDYTASPPPFSRIYTYQDRLWALSGGELLPNTYRSSSEQSMYVFYTEEREVIQSWFNATTQRPNFIDLSFKHEKKDELVGISSVGDNNLVFHGREALQVWIGDNPTIDGNFSWAKTVPISTVHGNLIQELPNDVLFMTDYGMRQLSTAFQSGEQSVGEDIGEDIDPTIEEMVRRLKSDTSIYKTAYSFYYPKEGLYGFKDSTQVAVYIVSKKAKGWVMFNGAFSSSRAFLSKKDGRLIGGANAQLVRYANGVGGEAKEYNDRGVKFSTIWFTPWIELNRRWFNQYWEFILDLNKSTVATNVQLRRYKDSDTAISSSIYELPVGRDIAFWDEALWDTALWDSPNARPKIRDQFKANNFAFALTTDDTVGGMDIVGINAIGAK